MEACQDLHEKIAQRWPPFCSCKREVERVCINWPNNGQKFLTKLSKIYSIWIWIDRLKENPPGHHIRMNSLHCTCVLSGQNVFLNEGDICKELTPPILWFKKRRKTWYATSYLIYQLKYLHNVVIKTSEKFQIYS